MPDNDFIVKDSGAREAFDTGAQRDTADDKPRMSLLSWPALIRVAWVYTRGAKKYGEGNWTKGMPYSRYLDSALRHISSWVMGKTDEDHLAMAVWNLMAILHHEEVGPPGLDNVTGNNTADGNVVSVEQAAEFARQQMDAGRLQAHEPEPELRGH